MASTKAAKSYAKAIFALAGETDKLDRVRGDLLALAKLREQSSELKSFFFKSIDHHRASQRDHQEALR